MIVQDPSEVEYRVSDEHAVSIMVNGMRASTFSQADVLARRVVVVHDGSIGGLSSLHATVWISKYGAKIGPHMRFILVVEHVADIPLELVIDPSDIARVRSAALVTTAPRETALPALPARPPACLGPWPPLPQAANWASSWPTQYCQLRCQG